MSDMANPSTAAVLDALRSVTDPDLHRDIVSLDFIKDLSVRDGVAAFTIELTTPACPVRHEMERWARESVLKVPGIREVRIQMTSRVTEARTGRRFPVCATSSRSAAARGGSARAP